MHDYASKEHVVAALRKGVRLDGRRLDEYRPIALEVNGIRNAEGSCKATCGEMILIAGVKLSTGTPFPDTPNSGVLIVNAELLPISSPLFEPGPPSVDSIELSRVIDRGIRESKAIDEESLCITPGERVWMANIDVCPINTDGHLFDIGGLASLVALKAARMPALVNGKPNYKEHTEQGVGLRSLPIPVTVCKIGEIVLIDPTQEEWALVDARLTVTTLEDGRLCSLQKGGDKSLTVDDIAQMIELGAAKGEELRKIALEALGE
jgi:exosome complex component RRP42